MFTGNSSAPEKTCLYAIGDVHGQLEQLAKLFVKIEGEMVQKPHLHHRIIMLGDYCDRGPNSKGVIEFLIKASIKHDVIVLLGNHDQRMLEFADIPEKVGETFLRFGGRETLISYGVEVDDDQAMVKAGKQFARQVPASHKKFLMDAKLIHIEGDYAFVHAGVRPGIELEKQKPGDLLWIRDAFLNHTGDFGKVIVHGHTKIQAVDIQPNRINVDSGAFESGILSCVVLEGTSIKVMTS